MTKRRLINAKAYEEMLLLKKLLNGDDNNVYVVSIRIEEDSEAFVVEHYYYESLKATIVGENYTIVSKMLIDYLSKL